MLRMVTSNWKSVRTPPGHAVLRKSPARRLEDKTPSKPITTSEAATANTRKAVNEPAGTAEPVQTCITPNWSLGCPSNDTL